MYRIAAVDTEEAFKMLKIVEAWGTSPENKDSVNQAVYNAQNSLNGLILTGIAAGYFPGTPGHNQVVYEKLRLAFEMGYYARAVRERSKI